MSGSSTAQACEEVQAAREEGFASAWFSNIFGLDALTGAAVAGATGAAGAPPGTEGESGAAIEIGTFVVPIYTRHPLTMAQQAIAVQDACRGRFTLGIGLSHQVVIESMMGIEFVKPALTMREYVSVLMPLLKDGSVGFSGSIYNVNAMLERPDGFSVPDVLVAALGPVMLEIAGSLADGTATWMTGPKTLKDHIIPTINSAAQKVGRRSPRIVAGLPICVTADVDSARQKAGRIFSIYGSLPSYRAMLDREGAEGPGQVALVGGREELTDALEQMAQSGVTDFVAAPFGNPDETAETRSLLVGFGKSK
ncbi:MAG TPA: TIGR03564 family F420-dependent LLM class oxidoreductase [Acidimicrobiales bacterium]|nr:TIGR03564 family F420-dependent LLM class oxidoreductase [Acidimicrobiales bacterium]